MKNKNLWLSYKMFSFKRSQKKKCILSFFISWLGRGMISILYNTKDGKKKLIGAQAPLEYHKPAKSLAQMLLEGF